MSLRMSRDQKVTDEKLAQARSLRQAATPAEKIMWEALRGRRFQGLKFRRQQVIRGFIVDFYCESANLIVELDGSAHDGADAQARDAQRTEIFKGLGARVIRFSNEEVIGDVSEVLESLSKKL